MPLNRVLALLREGWPEVSVILSRVWETPTTLADAISAVLRSTSYSYTISLQVMIIGSPDQLILCLVGEGEVVLYSPRGHLLTHPFVRELVEELDAAFEEYSLATAGDCLAMPLVERISTRLRVPSVLLVSLFHPEVYPAARLTLGISYLASFLRLHHLATVELVDCQFGANVGDVLEYVRRLRPDVLGVSVNFGQFDLMEKLLEGIYDPRCTSEPPIVILGNILPAMCYREILEAYPEVVICRKEGELALAALVKCGHDRSRWSQVPGIYYHGKQGQLISTPPSYLPMEHLPTPALDTVADLFARDGVMTAEFSRGCQYNQCSFCPRSHKGGIWRAVPVVSMLQQWEIFASAFRYFQRVPYIFLADEDFVGREDGEATIQRISDFLDGAREKGLQIKFDASCRADQIFREDRDQRWHVARGNLFKRCIDSGLSRLFLGVESGASAQLLRYNKGSTVEEMVSAIRYLSMLGVRLRFGFIFFDPLMSVQDLVENVEFLGRTDVVLPADGDASVEEIFHMVSSHHRQTMWQAHGRPIFDDVSYMVSPLEVLAKSRYLFDLRQRAPQLISKQIDVSFARYRTAYAVPEIGSICMACQYWVNYCFPIVYALKGMQKVSEGTEKELLHNAITGHRYLGYMLIRSLTQVFSLVDDAMIQHWEGLHASMGGHAELCSAACGLVRSGFVDEAIISILTWYEEHMRQMVEEVNARMAVLSPSKRQAWSTAYGAWTASSLVEAHALRIA